MIMSCINLPGIKSVSYIPTENLPADLVYQALSGCQITLNTPLSMLNTSSLPLCELEESPDNNTQIEKAKLTFSTLDSLPRSIPLAFLIETVNGENYIIGTRERPYPSIKSSKSTSKPEGEPAVIRYEVTFTARKALIPYTM